MVGEIPGPRQPEAGPRKIPVLPIFSSMSQKGPFSRLYNSWYEQGEAAVKSAIRTISLPENERTTLGRCNEITRDYFLAEAEAHNYAMYDYIEDTQPLYTDRESLEKINGEKNSAGTTTAWGVPVVAIIDSLGDGKLLSAAITLGHERDHSTTTRYFYDESNEDEPVHYTGLRRFRPDRTSDGGFLEEAMAVWDSVRIAKKYQEEGLFQEDFAAREERLSKLLHNPLKRVLFDDRKFGMSMEPSGEEAWEALVYPRERVRDLIMGTNSIRYLIHIKRLALALGRHITRDVPGADNATVEDLIEAGRQFLQKSRFAATLEDSDRAINTIYEMYGEKGKKEADVIVGRIDWKSIPTGNHGFIQSVKTGREHGRDFTDMNNALLYIDRKQKRAR